MGTTWDRYQWVPTLGKGGGRGRGGRGGKAGKCKMLTLADMEQVLTQSSWGGETVNGWSPDGSVQW